MDIISLFFHLSFKPDPHLGDGFVEPTLLSGQQPAAIQGSALRLEILFFKQMAAKHNDKEVVRTNTNVDKDPAIHGYKLENLLRRGLAKESMEA